MMFWKKKNDPEEEAALEIMEARKGFQEFSKKREKRNKIIKARERKNFLWSIPMFLSPFILIIGFMYIVNQDSFIQRNISAWLLASFMGGVLTLSASNTDGLGSSRKKNHFFMGLAGFVLTTFYSVELVKYMDFGSGSSLVPIALYGIYFLAVYQSDLLEP